MIGWLLESYNHSKYETRQLHEALITAFSEDQYMFGGRRSGVNSFGVKAAVTATAPAGSAVVLANYNRFCGEKCMSIIGGPCILLIQEYSAIQLSTAGQAMWRDESLGSVSISLPL